MGGHLVLNLGFLGVDCSAQKEDGNLGILPSSSMSIHLFSGCATVLPPRRNKVATGNRLLSAFCECLHKSPHVREAMRAPGLETADQKRLEATWNFWLASELKAACTYRLCHLTLIPGSQYQNCLDLKDMHLSDTQRVGE